MTRILFANEPILPGEVYVSVSLSDGSDSVMVYGGTEATIYTLKLAISDHYHTRPDQLDIILSPLTPYPLADKIRLDSIHPTHRYLTVIRNIPLPSIPSRYVQTITPSHKILRLVQVAAQDIPFIGDWIASNIFQQLDLGSDHPRIDEILMVVGHALVLPNVTELQTICFCRTLPSNHLPMITLDSLFAFYQTTFEKRIRILLDPFIFTNQTVVEFESWIIESAVIA